MPGILIVEDDRVLQRALRRLLEAEGYSVEISSDGRSALEAVRKSSLTAIILDLRLPLISGIDVCREIRHGVPSLPIIVLSASTDIADKVLLFELGADDYVTKPFSPRELLARVRVAIRRRAMPSSGDEMKFDGVLVDFVRMTAMREGQPVALTTSQFKILKFFLHHADEVISRETLLKTAPRPVSKEAVCDPTHPVRSARISSKGETSHETQRLLVNLGGSRVVYRNRAISDFIELPGRRSESAV